MTRHDAFARIFQLPAPMRPYLKLIVTEQEIDLVVGLEEQPLPRDQIAEMLQISPGEADSLLREAWKRDIIRRIFRDDQARYAPGQFYANLDYFSAYERGPMGPTGGVRRCRKSLRGRSRTASAARATPAESTATSIQAPERPRTKD